MNGNALKDLQDEVKTMGEVLVEHRMRLENGTKVFAEYNKRVSKVETLTTPKALSPLKIIGITLMVVLAGSGALWTLSNQLRDRPTDQQMDKVFGKHEVAGHQSMRGEIRAVQTEQVRQRVLIEGVKSEQKVQGKKLDRLLLRLPERRKR